MASNGTQTICNPTSAEIPEPWNGPPTSGRINRVLCRLDVAASVRVSLKVPFPGEKFGYGAKVLGFRFSPGNRFFSNASTLLLARFGGNGNLDLTK